jgi:DNA invertase Pin-like site-specific DNA recombinase
VAHLLGYARVSTALHDEALQLDVLKAAGCARIYTDHVSTRLRWKDTSAKYTRLQLRRGRTTIIVS